MSLTVWVAVTALFALWLRRPAQRDPTWLSVFSCVWLLWSVSCLSEVIDWAWLAHSTRIPMPDTVNFATSTGINPPWIIIGALVLCASMMAIVVPIARQMASMCWALRATFTLEWTKATTPPALK